MIVLLRTILLVVAMATPVIAMDMAYLRHIGLFDKAEMAPPSDNTGRFLPQRAEETDDTEQEPSSPRTPTNRGTKIHSEETPPPHSEETPPTKLHGPRADLYLLTPDEGETKKRSKKVKSPDDPIYFAAASSDEAHKSFSNFYKSPIQLNLPSGPRHFPTVEHAYHALKAPDDDPNCERFRDHFSCPVLKDGRPGRLVLKDGHPQAGQWCGEKGFGAKRAMKNNAHLKACKVGCMEKPVEFR